MRTPRKAISGPLWRPDYSPLYQDAPWSSWDVTYNGVPLFSAEKPLQLICAETLDRHCSNSSSAGRIPWRAEREVVATVEAPVRRRMTVERAARAVVPAVPSCHDRLAPRDLLDRRDLVDRREVAVPGVAPAEAVVGAAAVLLAVPTAAQLAGPGVVQAVLQSGLEK